MPQLFLAANAAFASSWRKNTGPADLGRGGRDRQRAFDCRTRADPVGEVSWTRRISGLAGPDDAVAMPPWLSSGGWRCRRGGTLVEVDAQSVPSGATNFRWPSADACGEPYRPATEAARCGWRPGRDADHLVPFPAFQRTPDDFLGAAELIAAAVGVGVAVSMKVMPLSKAVSRTRAKVASSHSPPKTMARNTGGRRSGRFDRVM